jgi:outer membrane protein assembly factor BamA
VIIARTWLFCFIALGICISGGGYVSAQQDADAYQDSVILAGERSRALQLEELQAVEILGCREIPDVDLLGVISSRASDNTLGRKLVEFYESTMRRNSSKPAIVYRRFAELRRSYENDRRFFESSLAKEDSNAILVYLNQQGFHNSSVAYGFGYDGANKKKTLRFVVTEGNRAQIDTLAIRGLERIDSSFRESILSGLETAPNSPFSESLLERDLGKIVRELRNNGYYQASYQPPTVQISNDGLHDTVLVHINVGNRKRIGSVVFEENANSFRSVSEGTRLRQLEFSEGEWYSEEMIELSRSNLMGLGTFEVVLIDTLVQKNREQDSLLHLRVYTRNAKPHDVGLSLLLYQTAVDNFVNLGLGATVQHRNAFGGAQVASLTTQYVLQDVSRVTQGQQLESEALASLVLVWPNIGRLFDQRIALQTSTFYSARQLITPFRLESFGLNARAPISLYSHTFFNGIDLSVGLERQIPLNFDFAINRALTEARTTEDSVFVRSTFNQFLVLSDFLSKSSEFFTGINAGFTLRGDHRNSPVNPTRGTLSSISVEWGWGAGKYIRGQGFVSTAFGMGPRVVGATKVRVGHIGLLDFIRGDSTKNNTYVPLERQFFAGGPASIRSFASRRLHDPVSGRISNVNTNDDYVLANVIGSASLLELGFEVRYTFARPNGMDDLWASLIERSGITFFTDIGNTFNRFTSELYGTSKFEDLLYGSAVALGAGYRFDTPVGPFRVDMATSVYDPTRTDGRWIVGRRGIFNSSNWQLSIGLGHAF